MFCPCFPKRKIKLLEQKLLEEEHERKLVQEKAEEVRTQGRNTDVLPLFSSQSHKLHVRLQKLPDG